MASKNSTSNTQRGQNFGGCIILRWICLIWIKMFKETTCNQKQLRRPVSSNFFMKQKLTFYLKKVIFIRKKSKKIPMGFTKKSHMGLGFPKSQIPYGKSHSGISHEEPLGSRDISTYFGPG